MIITKAITTNFSGLARNTSTPQGLGELKPGKIIDAMVLSNSNHGQVRLRIGNTVLTASTSITLNQNAHLQLEVVQIHPRLVLKPVLSSADAAVSKPLRDAMFGLLSRESGLAPSLAGLINRALMEGKHTELARLRSLVKALDKALPVRSKLCQAEGIRQAMLYSGIFLEALLARSTGNRKASTNRDIKACLLRLQQALESHKDRPRLDKTVNKMPVSDINDRPRLPRKRGLPVPQHRVAITHRHDSDESGDYIHELAARTKGAIARVGYLQAISADNFNNGEYMWQLEIPVKHTDTLEVVSMSIEKEPKSGLNEHDDSWIIRLALDLPQLGPVHIRISHFKQGVSTSFWSESEKVRSLIESRFGQLKSNLQQHGVKSLNLSCQEGCPAPPLSTSTDISSIDFLV